MSHVNMHTRFMLLVIHVVTQASTFQPGEVCEDINPHDFLRVSTGKTISNALAGKHVRIVELVWAPFAKRDPTVPGNAGWSGVDIELLEIISGRLNFTYDFYEMIRLPNETWTETLFRHLEHGDLIASYWLNTKYRRDRTYMLNGHIDSSIVLAVAPPKVQKPLFSEKFWTFLNPFSASAWLGIIGLCIISGVGYFLLEGLTQGDHYPFESIYEAINVMIFDENPQPNNPIARMHAPLWGFVSIVVLSIYTANMASFMAWRGVPTQHIKGIHDLIAQGGSACIHKDEPLRYVIDVNFPDIKYWRRKDSYLDTGLAVMGAGGGQQCDALMVPRVELKGFRTNDKMCGMVHVGEPLVPNEAGWVTSFASSCVGQAIETEMQDLYVTGKVEELIGNYRKAATCPPLADSHGKEENAPLYLDDLAGLFIVYLVGLISLLFYKILFGHFAAKTPLFRTASQKNAEEGTKLSRSLRRCCFGEDPSEDEEKVTLDAIMDRLQQMHKDIRHLQAHVQSPTDDGTTLDKEATEAEIGSRQAGPEISKLAL